jgi:hypothetical protein
LKLSRQVPSSSFVSLDSFEVGNVKATQMKACAIEFSRASTAGLDARGLIGINFLKSFQVRIEFQEENAEAGNAVRETFGGLSPSLFLLLFTL